MPCKLVEFEAVTDAGGPIPPHRSIPDIPVKHRMNTENRPTRNQARQPSL